MYSRTAQPKEGSEELRDVRELVWSPAEKKVAHAAFDAAYARECDAIRLEAEAMLKRSPDPVAIWHVHDYLSEKRRETDRKYDFRYSVLMNVLGRLLAEGWLRETDIAQLKPEKIAQIKRRASAWKMNGA